MRLRDERRRECGEQEQPGGTKGRTGPGWASDQPRRKEQGTDPAGHRHAGQQPQPADFAVARLSPYFERERTFGAQPFGVELFALQFEPMGVPLECFLQRRDHDTREPSLEAAKPRAAACLELLLLRVRRFLTHLPNLATACEIRDANYRVEDLKPRERHHFAPSH